MSAVIDTTATVISESISAPSALSAPEVTNLARARLHRIVENGVQNAGPVIEQVFKNVPDDALVRGDALTFETSGVGHVYLKAGEHTWLTHRNAFGQLLERVGMNRTYADSLAIPDEKEVSNQWRRELLAYNLNEHFRHDRRRHLIRSVAGEVRGFLSDCYRRLDSRPLLDAFVRACQETGAIPFEGVANAIRVSVRAILPRIVEPVPGEAMVFGLNWHNSDFGAGKYGVHAFTLRLTCLNGALGESALKQVHLGGRLPEDLIFSQKTYELDTETMVSATKDVVRSLLSGSAIERRSSAVRAAHASETDWARAFAKVGKLLTKAEQTEAREAFEGEDVVMLPPGKTLWRFSNALSWVANKATDPERKLELQQAAGAVLTSKEAS